MRVLVLLLAMTAVVQASTPGTVMFQGRLTDPAGLPVDTTADIAFRIYDAPSAGGQLWAETHSNVIITNGIFHVTLGSVVPFGNVFDGAIRYLSTQIGTGPESTERLPLISVPYAMKTSRADTADYALQSGGNSSGWIDDGTIVRLATNTDSVGIGTFVPAEKLHVAGDIRVGSNSSLAFGSDDNRLYCVAPDMVLTAGRDLYLRPEGDVYIRKDSYPSWVHFDNNNQKLGIGVTDPPYKLTVQGEISIASAGASKYHINYYNGGLNFAETGVSDRRLHIGDGGNVGIGTAMPNAKLGVNGDLKVNGAFRGDISSASGADGAPYPRPAYQSEWVTLGMDGYIEYTHNIGGDHTNYVVNVQRMPWWTGNLRSADGANTWWELTSSTLTLYSDYEPEDRFRVRIWVIE